MSEKKESKQKTEEEIPYYEKRFEKQSFEKAQEINQIKLRTGSNYEFKLLKNAYPKTVFSNEGKKFDLDVIEVQYNGRPYEFVCNQSVLFNLGVIRRQQNWKQEQLLNHVYEFNKKDDGKVSIRLIS